MNTESILMGALAFVIGAVIGISFLGKVKNLKSEKEAQADNLLKNAENKANEIHRKICKKRSKANYSRRT